MFVHALTEGQQLTAIFRWHSELLRTHHPAKCSMIRRIIFSLEQWKPWKPYVGEAR